MCAANPRQLYTYSINKHLCDLFKTWMAVPQSRLDTLHDFIPGRCPGLDRTGPS